MRNPGFEPDAKARDWPPEVLNRKLDWHPAKVPGWSYYPPPPMATGNFKSSRQQLYSGKCSGMFEGTLDRFVITVIPNVSPGTFYLVNCMIKNTVQTTREAKPMIQLHVRWLDKNRKWTQRSRAVTIESRKNGSWLKLERIVKVPPKAAYAVLLIRVTRLHTKEQVFVDDVNFKAIEK